MRSYVDGEERIITMSNITTVSGQSKGLSIISTVANDLYAAWEHIDGIAEDALDDLWNWGGGVLTAFAADELIAIKGAAEDVVNDTLANPAQILSPASEATDFLNRLISQQPAVFQKLTGNPQSSALITTVLSLTHLKLGSTPTAASVAPPIGQLAPTSAPGAVAVAQVVGDVQQVGTIAQEVGSIVQDVEKL